MEESKTTSYMGISTLLHIALWVVVTAIGVINPLKALENKKEEVKIEIVSLNEPVGVKAPQIKDLKDNTQGGKPAPAPAKSEDTIAVPKAKPALAKTLPAKTVKTVTKNLPVVPEIPVAKNDVAPEEKFDAEDIASDLDQVDQEVSKNFEDIEAKTLSVMDKIESKMRAKEEALEKARDKALAKEKAQMFAQQQARAKALKDEQDRARAAAQARAAARAQAEADARAAAQAAAQARAEQLAAERAAALAAAQKAAQARAGAYGGSPNGRGRGGNGIGGGDAENPGTGGGDEFGPSRGVRGLAQLKQMPGNAKPQYALEDRLQRKEGSVVFWAYVTREGGLEKFKLKQSTGHRSLDLKTLQALKKWRFYPGQQGWVEIPIAWNIKGEAQLAPVSISKYSN